MIERLPELHEAIINDILKDEHSRPVHFVDQAGQEPGKFTPEDLRIWLEAVYAGYSSVMATGGAAADGTKEYVTHDFTDYHTISNLLWGRKTQDRITTVAGHELQRRRDGERRYITYA